MIDVRWRGANFGGQEVGGEKERGCKRVVPCLVGEIRSKSEGVIEGKEGYSCTSAFCGGAVAAI